MIRVNETEISAALLALWLGKDFTYISVESLVSCEQISCRWMRRFPSNDGMKEGYP